MSATKSRPKDNNSEISETQKFDNVYKELEFYKKRCDILEKDLFKTQTRMKKLESQIKKLQEINTLNAKV